MSLTHRLLGPILRDDAARPLITFYDDHDGSRVELSGATLANWAAKTANWLVDDCDLAVGDPVHVALPAHWQTAGALLGAWWAGAHIVADIDAPAAVSLVATSTPASAVPPAQVHAVVALDPLGRGVAGPPAGFVDWSTEIRIHGDQFHPLDEVPATSPALLGATVDEVHAAALQRGATLGIEPGARVLSTLDWTLPDGLTDGLLAVLAARASLVHCANPNPAALTARRTTERITADLGP